MLLKVRKFLRLCSSGATLRNSRLCSTGGLQIDEHGVYESAFPNTGLDNIQALLKQPPQCVYAGFDPTADSLHVGNLLILMNLLHWQRAGHQVIALLGGATGMIGDPSHRKKERVQIDNFVLEQNLKAIEKDVKRVFDNHKQIFWSRGEGNKLKPVLFVNNFEWYKKMNLIGFIRDMGKHFRMGTMLGRTSVQERLNSESGMSFTEFCYSVFQAYDWLHLYRNYKCRFQIGGSDQMGNIVAGYDLVTKFTDEQVFGLTLPLITAEGGKKFGKSTGNAIWLSPAKSSSFRLYQFFIRTADADVERYLRYFTFLKPNRIQEIVLEHRKNPEERTAQKILAEQVTLLVHGEIGLDNAKKATAALYDSSIESLANLSADELLDVFFGANMVQAMPEPGQTVFDLAMKIGCFKTEHDAKRIIEAGGFYVNNRRTTNDKEVVVNGIHVLRNNVTLLRVGKKTYHIVKWL